MRAPAKNRGSYLPQASDPKQRTTWQRPLTSGRVPVCKSRVLTTSPYPSLCSRFRLPERAELAGGKAGMVLLGEI